MECALSEPRRRTVVPEGHEQLERRRETPRQARLHTGAQPHLVGLFQLRDLVLDHLDPGGLLHLVRPWLEQRRTGRDRVGLADRLDLHPDHRPVHVRVGVGVPDLGRNLLVGSQTRRTEGRLLHRLAEPDRPDRDPGVGGLRLRDVPRPDARHVQRGLVGGLQPDQDVRSVRGHPGRRRRSSTSSRLTCWRSSTTSRCGGT